MSKLYHFTPRAIDEHMTWDQVFAENELQLIGEFDTLEEAEEAAMCYDADFVHVEP